MPTLTVIPDGKRIREVRKERKLSCAKVAASCPRYRHERTINRIERGAVDRVSLTLLTEIAQVLNVPVSEFIRQDEAA